MAKGRHARTPADVTDVSPPVDEAKFAGAMQAMQAQGLAEIEAKDAAETRVRAVATTLGYQLPADCCDPDLIQRDIAINMRRSVEACLEVGRGLRVLKEACQHGEFAARLDVLGINVHVAARFMQSASKFSKLPSTATLKAIGNQTKLFEMLVLDDEQIEELELTGQTGELKLDDVASMSVKELRAALRELRAEHGAAEEVRARLNSRIDKLELEKQRVQTLPPDAALADLYRETAGFANEALGMVHGRLRQAFVALADHHAAHGGNSRQVMAGHLGQLQTMIHALREEFMLPDTVGDGTPEWQRWADAQDAKAATGVTN